MLWTQLHMKAYKSLKNNVFITTYYLVKPFPIVYFDLKAHEYIPAYI